MRGENAIRRSVIAAFLMLLIADLGISQEQGVVPPVADPRDHYTVGFSQLSAPGLPAEYRYVASSLPRLVVDSLGADAEDGITHTYADSEVRGYASSLIDAQLQAAIRTLSGAVRERDDTFFNPAATADQRDRVDQAAADARAAVDQLRTLAPTDVHVAADKPLVFWDGRSTGRLLDPVELDDHFLPDPGSLDRIAHGADLDLLIWGIVEEIRGYLKVDFYAYSPYQVGMDLSDAGTVALPSDIGQEAEIMAGAVASVLLGRPWGSVHVVTDVEDAAITVNGKLIGYREVRARYLEPGEATVEARAAGYRSVTHTVAIADREQAEVDVHLEPLVGRTVRIESAPADADVYVDSVWTGRTPTQLVVPDRPQTVVLRHEGYLESRFVLGSDTPDRVARVLLPGSLNWSDEIAAKRGEFYNSLSWFVLSVPVTMILNGVYQSVFGAYPPTDDGELPPETRISFARLGNIFYWASGGALLVNLGLLVNVGINLFEYLDVGEGAHNQ